MGGFCSACETFGTSVRPLKTLQELERGHNLCKQDSGVNGINFWKGLTYTHSHAMKISHLSNE